jgi:hypothetical protein
MKLPKTVQTQTDIQLRKPSIARARQDTRTDRSRAANASWSCTAKTHATRAVRARIFPDGTQIRRPAANRTPVWTLLVSRSDICTGIGRPETDRRYPRAAISTGRPPPPPDPLAACRYSPQTPELARVSSQILFFRGEISSGATMLLYTDKISGSSLRPPLNFLPAFSFVFCVKRVV